MACPGYHSCFPRPLPHKVVPGPVASASLGAHQKCRLPGPTPDLLNQSLPFPTIPRGSECILKCSRGSIALFTSKTESEDLPPTQECFTARGLTQHRKGFAYSISIIFFLSIAFSFVQLLLNLICTTTLRGNLFYNF